MTDLYGFKAMGPLQFEEMLSEEKERQDARKAKEKDAVDAYAHTSHALGVKLLDMTPTQQHMAETVGKAWVGRQSAPRGYGFSIDPTGRVPTRRLEWAEYLVGRVSELVAIAKEKNMAATKKTTKKAPKKATKKAVKKVPAKKAS